MVKLFAAGGGALLLVALILWFGGRSIGAEVLQAGWAIPVNIMIHMAQLFCAGCAWRLLVGDRGRSLALFYRLRIIREAVNALLPVANIGGVLVAVRLMIGSGIPAAIAAAGTTLDLTIEGVAQLLFTLAGVAALTLMGIAPAWLHWVDLGLAAASAALLIFLLAQRAGLLARLGGASTALRRRLAFLRLDRLGGVLRELNRLQSDPAVMIEALSLQLLSWLGGCFEIYCALLAMGREVSPAQALVIESLAMAARSAAFAVPAGLGVQEGGFILVGGLFGVTPESALALAMVKRLRELAVGGIGLLLWQWSEIGQWLRREGR